MKSCELNLAYCSGVTSDSSRAALLDSSLKHLPALASLATFQSYPSRFHLKVQKTTREMRLTDRGFFYAPGHTLDPTI